MKLAITGVSGYFGRLAVSALEPETSVTQIIGLDVHPPGFSSVKLRFVPLDVRSAGIVRFLKEEQVESVLHLAWIFNPSHNHRFMYDVNVNGTKNVMTACREAGVKHIIFPSSTTCYGANADNPEWLREDAPLRGNPDFPYTHHKVLIERFCDEFERDNPDTILTRLRICIVLGKNVDNFIRAVILVRGFRHAQVRGHNPAIQFLHEDDLARLLPLVLSQRPGGVFNVSPDDALTMSVIAELSRNPFFEYPYWVLRPLTDMLWSLRLMPVPASYLRFIMHRWAASNARIKHRLGWQPRYSTSDALSAVPRIG